MFRMAPQEPPEITQENIAEWKKKKFPKHGDKETPVRPVRIVRYFNWTDTRGDKFAIAVCESEKQARECMHIHAAVHAAEMYGGAATDKRNQLLGEKMLREAGSVLVEITRRQFEEICRTQVR